MNITLKTVLKKQASPNKLQNMNERVPLFQEKQNKILKNIPQKTRRKALRETQIS